MHFVVESMWSPGMTERSVGPWRVAVRDGQITGLERGEGLPEEVISGTMLPGFVDSHDHIGIDVGDEHAQSIEPAGRMLLRGASNLRQMLEGGITTLRDCGERGDVEASWVEAVEQGIIPGPRVIRSISPICRTGGHAWYLSHETDGEEALRARVRQHLREGADFIKIMVSGGIGTAGSDQSLAEYTQAEVDAVVEEAHRLGMPVAAHGHGGAGVDYAIRSGVDTIEHGALLTDEQLSAMASADITLVLTNAVIRAYCTDSRVPEGIRSIMEPFAASALDMTKRARQAGVHIALGSDCVHGGLDEEIQILLECGYTTQEALEAATANGAQVVRRPDLGVLEVGAAADLQILAGDPIEDGRWAPARVAVMHRGKWLSSPFQPPLTTITGGMSS